MHIFNNISGRVVAAVSSLALSAFFLATAIIPASPNILNAGMVA